MSDKPRATPPVVIPAAAPGTIRVIGAPRAPVRDVFHALLRMSWSAALGVIVAAYLALNSLFALAYLTVGGIGNAPAHSFRHAFYFSVQTMGTIGYGSLYPASDLANALVVLESVVGLVVTALATGLVFAKFARTTARVAFSRQVAIGPMDGVPTLMVRVGNERANQLMETQIRISMVRTERTREGMTFYRMYDLPLVRERAPSLSRSWTAMHPIREGSPLYGQTPKSLAESEVELMVTVAGVDDTSLQPVYALRQYDANQFVWGARHADMLTEEPDGALQLDLRKFHDLTITEPTADFPYPAK